MLYFRRKHLGFTLIELLIVIAVISILVGALLPGSDPNVFDQLRSTAQIVGAELAYGRSLAMANNSKYIFTFDMAQNSFTLKHNGTNSSLNKLPASPFKSSSDTLYQHVVNLNELPHLGPTVRIASVVASGTPAQHVSDLEFNYLGATTRSESTVIWLSAGSGSNTRYISISIDPVIGSAQIGNYSVTAPP